MEATATTSKLLLETGRLLASLQQRLRSDEDFAGLARQLGWDLAALPAPVANLLPQLEQLDAAVWAVIDEVSLSSLAALQSSVTAVFGAIKDLANASFTLPPPFDAVAFRAEFPQQLLNVLLVEYLQAHHDRIYGLLYGAGLITREYVPASGARMAYVRVRLNLHLLADLLRDPLAFWRAVYGWGATFAYDKVVMAVADLLDRVGVHTGYAAAKYELLTTINPGPIPNPEALPLINSLQISILHTLTSLGELYLGVQLLPVLDPAGTPQGLALAVQATGALDKTIALGNDFELTLAGEASLAAGVGLALQPTQPLQVKALAGAGGAVSGRVEAAVRRRPTGVAGTPQLLLRTPGNTELTYETVTWKVGALASTTAAADLYTELTINALRFASGGGDNDSFLSQVLKNFNFKTDLSVGLSKAKGFYFDAAGGLNTRQTKNISLGPVQLTNVGFALETVNSFTYLTVISDVQAKLGPIQVDINGVGLKAGLKYTASGGAIGPFTTDIAFKSPTALGISIKTDAVTGGGYLYFDPANHKYAGAAQLSFKDKINLNALGLLQTELPNNQPGYSFLLLITAQFNPIQLGMGFTLNAIGGLVGINRSVSTAFLRSLVATGRQDTLLFPANVLDNPQEALAIVDSAFPATEGKYVFGLMARIGWGTPNLITLDVALIIQLPAPVRLVLLGILKATLPSESSPMVRIRADFLGIVDFGAKQVSFDATLVDSRILQFVLTGDMAFRLYQGDNPVFVLTAGGFHPAFQPPANADLPTLRRMTLALAQGGDFRLTLTSYLAITSNTVQFGSRLDLYVGLPASYYIEGFLAFDALFQFNPFHVEVWIGAGVAIKRNGSAKLSIGLSLLVSGPGPWHVAGEGSFKILFFRIRFRVDRTFGSNTAQPALPTTNVRQLLLAALRDTANWEIEAPAERASSTTVLRTEESPTELVVDPGGALVVRQKLVPLGFPIEVYGNTRPVNGSRFVITSVLFGEGTPAPEAVSDVRDAFAPAQFQRLSDAQKLSAPSFQLLRNGIRVEALDGLVGSGGTTQTVRFELKVIEPAPADTDTAGRTTAGGITVVPSINPVTTALPGDFFQGLARNGAVGRSRRSYEQRRPSRKAPDQVLWDEDSYAVVLTRNLQLAPGAPNPFVTEAEATAYLAQQLGLRPALAGAWQVLPVYQLDVSAPAVAATLATA